MNIFFTYAYLMLFKYDKYYMLYSSIAYRRAHFIEYEFKHDIICLSTCLILRLASYYRALLSSYLR